MKSQNVANEIKVLDSKSGQAKGMCGKSNRAAALSVLPETISAG